jgi:hypothetical protein
MISSQSINTVKPEKSAENKRCRGHLPLMGISPKQKESPRDRQGERNED